MLVKKSSTESTTDACGVGFPGDWAMVFFNGGVMSVLRIIAECVACCSS